MQSTIVAGVDPGIVHTGLVVLDFTPSARELEISHAVIDGLDAHTTRAELEAIIHPRSITTIDTYVEKYRVRGGHATNDQMLAANPLFQSVLAAHLQSNTGVQTTVNNAMLKLMELWHWPTTHHQDLRSAARIAVLGMLLDKYLNTIVYQYITDNLNGRTWNVHHH